MSDKKTMPIPRPFLINVKQKREAVRILREFLSIFQEVYKNNIEIDNDIRRCIYYSVVSAVSFRDGFSYHKPLPDKEVSAKSAKYFLKSYRMMIKSIKANKKFISHCDRLIWQNRDIDPELKLDNILEKYSKIAKDYAEYKKRSGRPSNECHRSVAVFFAQKLPYLTGRRFQKTLGLASGKGDAKAFEREDAELISLLMHKIFPHISVSQVQTALKAYAVKS